MKKTIMIEDTVEVGQERWEKIQQMEDHKGREQKNAE
jgi:hypothetical protein